MEPVLEEARPDVVLVHGDTTTSTAAALAAFYQQIPVGHVEAGLRTNDRWLPFPEEMNRRITGTIATLSFRADAARARTSARGERRRRRHHRHRQHGDRRVSRHRAARRSSAAAALERARSGAADRPRHRAPARESSVHARDVRGDARRSRSCRRARRSTGRCIRRRTSRPSRTRCSTASTASCWSSRSTTPQMVAAVRGCDVRAHRFGRLARRSADAWASRCW